MDLVVDDFETLAGVVLQPATRPLTDEEFLDLCERYPDCRVENTAEGDIIIMPPAHPRTGQRNARITQQLGTWADLDGRGQAYDSSTGFFLRNGARRSPDAAWVSNDRLRGIMNDAAMWHVTPEFVIELKSASDRTNTLRSKMHEWIENGVELGWLIIPETRTVEIYSAGGQVTILDSPAHVDSEGPVEGFRLDLKRIFDPLY